MIDRDKVIAEKKCNLPVCFVGACIVDVFSLMYAVQ